MASLQRRNGGRAQRRGARRGRIARCRAGGVERITDHLGDRIDRRADRQVHDAVGVGARLRRHVGEGVPGEDGQ